MILHNEVAGQQESQVVISGETADGEASQIEEVLNRAYQIHHAHGGWIGYDLEDWQQAEQELIDRSGKEHFHGEETAHDAPLPRGRERNFDQ
jgi:hypothetical protein